MGIAHDPVPDKYPGYHPSCAVLISLHVGIEVDGVALRVEINGHGETLPRYPLVQSALLQLLSLCLSAPYGLEFEPLSFLLFVLRLLAHLSQSFCFTASSLFKMEERERGTLV